MMWSLWSIATASCLALVAAQGGGGPAATYIASATGTCRPRLDETECEGASYKGLVIYFHGFSACSTQIDELAPRLNGECFDVLSPVAPGHEIGVSDCNSQPCSVKFDDTHGFDLSTLPTDGGEIYASFTNEMASLAKQQLAFRAGLKGVDVGGLQLVSFGLSLGATMAYRAVVDNPGVFTRQLLVNPMMGAGDENVDIKVHDCLEAISRQEKTDAQCAAEMRPVIAGGLGVPESAVQGDSMGAMEASLFQSGVLLARAGGGANLNTKVMWGENCPKILQEGRGGFCAFQRKHLLAAHSFGITSLDKPMAGAVPVTQLTATERDGVTRNGLIYSMACGMEDRAPQSVAMCMYPFREGVDIHYRNQYWGHENCVPHACIGSAENPGSKWWEPMLSDNFVNFIAGRTDNIGQPWSRERTNCGELPLGRDQPATQPWLRVLVLPEADPSPASGGVPAAPPAVAAAPPAAPPVVGAAEVEAVAAAVPVAAAAPAAARRLAEVAAALASVAALVAAVAARLRRRHGELYAGMPQAELLATESPAAPPQGRAADV